MEIHYAQSDEVALAYAVEGSADLPLIYIPGLVSNLAIDSSVPGIAQLYDNLSRFTRFARWDRRGIGLSDQTADPLPLAEQERDLEVIRAAVGFERFALAAFSHGAALALQYAASHPERVSHLVLIGALFFDTARDIDDSDAEPRLDWETVAESTRDFRAFADRIIGLTAPSLEPALRAPGINLFKASVSPSGMRQLLRQIRGLDLRSLLPSVRVPTLILHPRDDRMVPVSHARYAAAHVPGARYVELDGSFHAFFLDPMTTTRITTAIEEFLTGTVRHSAERVMTTVLFTDIVDSTLAQQRMGDESWSALRKSFESGSRRIVEGAGGRVVQFTGDGVMASFPAASQALRAARALADDARKLGVSIRAGIHAGEAYTVDEQLFGTCVTVAARVADCAGAGELLTTETVGDLVAGSDFRFRDAGGHELKGLGPRRLLAAE